MENNKKKLHKKYQEENSALRKLHTICPALWGGGVSGGNGTKSKKSRIMDYEDDIWIVKKYPPNNI